MSPWKMFSADAYPVAIYKTKYVLESADLLTVLEYE